MKIAFATRGFETIAGHAGEARLAGVRLDIQTQ